MAELTLSIGPLSSNKTATNANAQRVLESAFALYHEDPETYTDQEKLDYITQVLIPEMLKGAAYQYEEQTALKDAADDLKADPPVFE